MSVFKDEFQIHFNIWLCNYLYNLKSIEQYYRLYLNIKTWLGLVLGKNPMVFGKTWWSSTKILVSLLCIFYFLFRTLHS